MSPETHISHGKVLQVIGPVVDVSFEGELPEIYTALRVSNPSISDKAGNLVLEVAQHIGEHVVRTIAMDSTDGLVRGMAVENTGRGISVPVGKEVLGRIMNVIGEPVDEQGVIEAKERWEIHRPVPSFEEQAVSVENFETGIKVVDLLAPYQKGGKIGLAVQASAKPSSSWSSSTTSPSSTAVIRSLRALASARAKATTCIGKWSNRASSNWAKIAINRKYRSSTAR